MCLERRTVASTLPRAVGRWLTAAAGVLLGLGLLAPSAWAIDTPNERITLVDLTGVHVVFEEIGEPADQQGLSRARLQPEVESRLRRAGLLVLTPAAALTSAGRPTLHVRVTLLPIPDAADVYAYSVDLTLRQRMRLVRDRTIESHAITWSEHRVVGAARRGDLGVVRSVLLRKVDEFVEAWRVSNRERY